MLVGAALVGLAFVPQAAAQDTCVLDTQCVGEGEQFCLAHTYSAAPDSDRVYIACNYYGDTTCAAALYDVPNTNNHGIACVAFGGSCLYVAVITNDDAGTGWQPIVC